MCVCVCARARARARARVCVCVKLKVHKAKSCVRACVCVCVVGGGGLLLFFNPSVCIDLTRIDSLGVKHQVTYSDRGRGGVGEESYSVTWNTTRSCACSSRLQNEDSKRLYLPHMVHTFPSISARNTTKYISYKRKRLAL